MKDIDFDELDRAVGSVLGTDAKADESPKTDAPAVATATSDPVAPVAASTSDDTNPAPIVAPEPSDAPEATAATPEIKPSVSPARKRGQFLDMVHPLANMRKSSPLPTNTRKTLAPLNTGVAPDVTDAKPLTESADSAVSEQSAQAVTTPEVVTPVVPPVDSAEPSADAAATDTKSATWPDPLDFAKDSSAAPVEPEASAPEPTPAPEATQTPFVPDAKVDKRPLGAFASQEEESAEADAPATEAPKHTAESDEHAPEFNAEVNSIEAAGVPQAEDEATGLTGQAPSAEASTEESSSSGAHVESAETTEPTTATPEGSAPESHAEAPEPQEEARTEEPKTDEAKPEASEKSTTVAETAAAAPAVTGQAPSIPQQYKTAEPSKSDDDAHPLFDTEEYHQPLLADGKKKSKKIVLIIVLLLILLVLGGALGYVAYNVGI